MLLKVFLTCFYKLISTEVVTVSKDQASMLDP